MDPQRTRGADKSFTALIAAVPIVLVNTLAVIGQCEWAGSHLHWGRPGQALFAGALETTALAVMYLAHTALIEGDSAWRQKGFAYAIACGSASVNWQEHSNDWHPTPAAFVFAGASLLSPILWATYSRFAARTVMRAAGLIDKRAAKFSFARWVMFPRRTFVALRYSVWHSVQSPSEAIAGSRGGNPAAAVEPGTRARTQGGKPKSERQPRAALPPIADADPALDPASGIQASGNKPGIENETNPGIDPAAKTGTEDPGKLPDAERPRQAPGGTVTAINGNGKRSPEQWAEIALPLYRRYVSTHNDVPTAANLARLIREAHPDLPMPRAERSERNIRAATERLAEATESEPERDREAA
jgi:uncharacterized protein DUF2637